MYDIIPVYIYIILYYMLRSDRERVRRQWTQRLRWRRRGIRRNKHLWSVRPHGYADLFVGTRGACALQSFAVRHKYVCLLAGTWLPVCAYHRSFSLLLSLSRIQLFRYVSPYRYFIFILSCTIYCLKSIRYVIGIRRHSLK